MKDEPLKILIIGPSWVGDMVMAQSLFIVLKQQHPHSQIDVLAPPWSLPLLQRMPEVHQALGLPLGHGQFGLLTRFKIGRKLKHHGYDQAIVLPNSWKSALIPFFAGIPRRTGYLGELRRGLLNDLHSLEKTRLTMTVQRFVALAFAKSALSAPTYPYPQLTTSLELQTLVSAKFGLADKPLLALCPGAEYGPAKRWPVAHFAEVARQKQSEGWQIGLFGSEKDRAVCTEINSLSGDSCHNFAGKTQLHEALDLLSIATVVVSNDSGLMHIAAAVDTKLIAIYGSSDPGFTPPLHSKATILQLHLPCSPCFKRVCPLQHTHCLTELSPATVLAAIEA
ncbi:lipopolysaccharide heptosyltransferase II [Methylomonas sp. AM2-LC]|uniref:lipopolysaccharide heptosyltransferase II n=1 Tax=Methylomonas sp. AM2-LC TaxID=3153301 RepID=UPI0032673EDD